MKQINEIILPIKCDLDNFEIELKKIAPLRDPIEVKIKGYNLSLRKSEAKNIDIELIE